MELKLENGKWEGNLMFIDIYINLQREFPKPIRTKIDHSQNHKFKKNG